MTALSALVFLSYRVVAEPDAQGGATTGESSPVAERRAKVAAGANANVWQLLGIAEDEATHSADAMTLRAKMIAGANARWLREWIAEDEPTHSADDVIGRAKVAAGPNANAVLSLDLDIDASDPKMDDGNKSGTVTGAGTDVVVEVFITGLAGPIIGGEFSIDTNRLSVKSAAATPGLSVLGTTARTVSFGGFPPGVALPNGYLATVTLTTVSDVTGTEFTVSASMNVADGTNIGETDMLTAATPLTFNAMGPTPDFDSDGMVGFSDFLAFAGQYGAQRGDSRYQAKYDLNGDGAIDFQDFLSFASSYGNTVPPPPPPPPPGGSSSPDLIVESPSVSDSTLTPGQSFTLRATVRNRGTGQSAETTLRYYRSSDATISTSDTEVGTDLVSGLSTSRTSPESIRLTAPSSAGTYYFGACVASVSGESNTDNNCSAGVRVTVSDDHSNTRSGATSLSLGGSRSGRIETGGDVDYFRVQVSSSGTLTVYTTGNTDTYGTLQSSSGSTLATNDDGGSGTNFSIARSVSAGTYYIAVRGYSSSETGSYTVHASFQSSGSGGGGSGGGSDDHSNTRSGATSLSLGGSRSGRIETGGDVDYFRVQVSRSGTLTVYTTGSTDTYGTLQSSSGTTLETDDDDGSGTNFSIARSVSAGTYYIKVEEYGNNDTGSYTVHARFQSGGSGGGSGGTPKMYWTDEATSKIQRANLDGSNVEDLITTGLSAPAGIALDLGRGKMYWTDTGTSKIQRANLDGSNVEDLITTGLSLLAGIALDVGRRKMYWINPDLDGGGRTSKIQRANLDGSNVEDLITTGLDFPIGIALDLGRGKMYWTNTDLDGGGRTSKIQRANLDGSNVKDLITTGLSGPFGIALDVGRGKMYWTDGGTDKIQRANLDGSNVEDLITTGLSGPRVIALDVGRGKMYWTASPRFDRLSKIQRANLDGSNVEDLITTGLRGPFGIALDLR